MTSAIPFLLPLKANEAATLAETIFQHLDNKALDDEQRSRLASRSASLGLASIRPCWGSLQADPVHGSSYYLAIDATGPEGESALLLHMAPASAPSSALFPKPMLIGRMRPGGGREIVVNAMPFGPRDATNIETVANKIDRAFLPRPSGAAPSLCVRAANDGALEGAFDGFRKALKSTGVNYAAAEASAGAFHSIVWAAIRTGWREGYTAGTDPIVVESDSPGPAQDAIHAAASFSKFTLDLRPLGTSEAAVNACFELSYFIRREKAANKTGRAFDLEIDIGDRSPGELARFLLTLRQEGCPVQFVRLSASAASPEAVEAVRAANAMPSVDADGRWHWRVSGDLSSGDTLSLIQRLRS